ncbi:transposase [Akanthomyces lecanii RCEF 1005]|uniref:Transposase n=1 Tax=Akanthomyces lecanii RCEF 1005 TaxID=1081108 RepID=A0A167R7V8_CORDF|nr:transposase [Akanthomyces lecanii RCEF 1005]
MSSDRAAEHSNYSVKKHIVDTLQLKPTQILDARKIRTGWSVYPDTTETQQFMLSEQQKWLPALNATQADKQETWYTFIVEDCPRHLRSITGDHMALMDAAYDEIVTATGQAPVNFHIRNKDDNTTPNAVLIVSFNIDKQADGSFSALAERQD